MEVDCEGCAGCCLDWRSLVDDPSSHEREGNRTPIDDMYNFVPLTRDEVEGFYEHGLTDALVPRLWRDDEGLVIDEYSVATINGSPVFYLGPAKPPKPVAPFDTAPSWLPTCVFLDPETLQCRIHDSELYPAECAEYPGHNLELGVETECERVEDSFGGHRLLDGGIPDDISELLLGPQAIGQKIFIYPDIDRLASILPRIEAGEVTTDDSAEFVAAALAGSPGTTSVDIGRVRSLKNSMQESTSWAGTARESWESLNQTHDPESELANTVESTAPPTPGWETE